MNTVLINHWKSHPYILPFESGVVKLRPAGPTRVYYAVCRHVHVRKVFEVLFRVFESQPVKLVPQFKNIIQNCEQLHSSH